MLKNSIAILLTLFFVVGCTLKTEPKKVIIKKGLSPHAVQKMIEDDRKKYLYDEEDRTFLAVGEGLVPRDVTDKSRALVLARKAALADAYKRLGEKLYGVKISSTENVKDAMLQNSRIVAKVHGLIKDATIVEEKFIDGIYKLKLELKISKKLWYKIFSY
jgi:hypothetical protein